MAGPIVVSRQGGEFLVNTETRSTQAIPGIAGLSSGGYVVTWVDFSSQGLDTSGSGIKAQIYDASGHRVGGEFLVNSVTGGSQRAPTITGLSNGGFVVAWEDESRRGRFDLETDIRAQVYNASGTRVGAEFLVNSTTNEQQNNPAITGLSNGGFVVSWTDASREGGDADEYGTKAQIYDADGRRIGGEFLVNSVTGGSQQAPTITGLRDGGFVVAWRDSSNQGLDTSESGIKAQVFDAGGRLVRGEFLVNSVTQGLQFDPAITDLSDGGFVVTWVDYSANSPAAPKSYIKAQVYDASGIAVGGELFVSSATDNTRDSVAITSLENGGFVVAWRDAKGDESKSGVKAQVFDAGGRRLGDEFLVNTVTADYQYSPTITGLFGGGFAVAWMDQSKQDDRDSVGIKAQIFVFKQAGALTLAGLDDGHAVEGRALTATLTDPAGVTAGTVYTFADGATVLQTGAAATYTPGAAQVGRAITVSAAYTDSADRRTTVSTRADATLDLTTPTVTGLTSSTQDGAYRAGAVIDIAVGFSEAVTVTGTPRLTLETGATDRAADYVSGSGTASLVFRYTVQPGDTAADLDALTLGLNGGTIRDAAGNAAILALPAAGGPGSLAAAAALVIDTTAPAAPVLTFPAAGSATNDATPTIAGIAEAGSRVTILIDSIAIGTVTADGAGRFSLAVPTALAEGPRLVTARAADAAGNVSADAPARIFTVDLTAPSLTIGPVAGDDRLNAAEHGQALVVAGTTTAEDGRLVTLGLAGRSYVATVTGGAWSVTVPGADVAALPDTAGTPLVLTADVSDQVGNPAVPATRSLAIDTIAPSVPGLALAADTGASASDRVTRNPTLVVTGDSDAVLTYALDGGGFTATAPDLAVDGSRDGAHTVRVRATDAAGNVAETSLGFTLDTRAPVAPGLALAADTGASAVDGLTRDARLAVAAEPGASLRYSLDGAPETATYDPAALADGVHTVAVTQTDAAGNVSAAASLGFTLDRTAPSVTALTPDTAGPTRAGTLAQAVTFSEAVTGLDAGDFALVVTGTAAARIAGVSGSGATYTVTLADVTGDGTLRLDLAAGGTGIQDLAGNAVTGGFAGGVTVLDHSAPSLTVDPVAGDGWLSAAEHGQALVVAGTTTAEDGQTVTLGLAGRTYTGTVAGGAWSVGVPASDVAALPDTAGTPLVLTADVSDQAGNPAMPATRTLAIDTTADAGGDAALILDATADAVVNAAEARAVAFTLAGLDPDATAVVTVSDGTASRSVTLAADGPASLDLSGLDGTVTGTLAITDHLGNTVTRAGGTLLLDTVAPAAPGLALTNDTGPDAGDRVTADPRLAVTPAEAGGTLRTTVDGAAVPAYDPAALGPGAHRVEVVQVDAAGNASAPARLDFTLLDYFETITGEGPGNLTLTGTDFADLIRGHAGDDTVRGGRGADYLHGLAGNDSVDGGPGDDSAYGDLGDDRVDGGAGDDQVRGWFGDDVLFGSAGNDGVFGEEGDDFLGGGSGDDYLSGGAGEDALYGEEGDDLLFGNAGNDELVGGAGRDRFAFGRGDGQDVIRDFVTGGAEADVIAFNNRAFADFAGVQAALRQEGADAVLAYGDGDTVTIRNVQASSLTAANFTFA